MITYLWTKQSGDTKEYIGLYGKTWSGDTPQEDEIRQLYNSAKTLTNNEIEYKRLFDTNVAEAIGAQEQDYVMYYFVDGCLDKYKIGANTENDGGSLYVEAKQSGDTIVFTFYNLSGGTSAVTDIYTYTKYATECDPTTAQPTPEATTSTIYNTTMKWAGLCTTQETTPPSSNSDYSWFKIGGSSEDGEALVSCFAFKRTNEDISETQPTGGTYADPKPDGWSDTVPSGSTETIWMTKAIFSSKSGIQGAWSKPSRMVDTVDFNVEWTTGSTRGIESDVYDIVNKTGYTLNDFSGDESAWRRKVSEDLYTNWSDSATNATYMATCKLSNGSWSNWSVSKIKGETGAAGSNGGRSVMIFANIPTGETPNSDIQTAVTLTSANTLSPSTLSGTTTGGTEIEWTTNNNGGSGYTWVSEGLFSGNYEDGKAPLIGLWATPFRITGDNGKDGEDGSSTEFIYGRFHNVDEYNEFISDATTGSPYVSAMTQTAYTDTQGVIHLYSGDDFVPYDANWKKPLSGWTDNPQGITEDLRVEICCSRKKKDGVWSGSSENKLWYGPTIWASWGEDGIDGDGVEYIYKITSSAIISTGYTYVEVTETEGEAGGATSAATLPSAVTESSDAYIYIIDKGGEKLYYGKEVKINYGYPYDNCPVLPPRNFEKNDFGASANPSTSLYAIITPSAYTEESAYTYDIETLSTYYQDYEFVPGNKIATDVANAKTTDRIYGQNWLQGWNGGWTDNPLDVGPTQPYEWVSMRKKTNGVWGAFNEPRLWGKWSEDGTSVFTSMVFCKTIDNIVSMELSGGTFTYPYPDEYIEEEHRSKVSYSGKTYYWYDSIPEMFKYYYEETEMGSHGYVEINIEVVNSPTESSPEYAWCNYGGKIHYYVKHRTAVDECIWCSTKIFGDDESENQEWTAPRKMSDTTDFNVEWCASDSLTDYQITKLTSDEYNFGNFRVEIDDQTHTEAEKKWRKAIKDDSELGMDWTDSADGGIYMATASYTSGSWSNWKINKVKGEKGDEGVGYQIKASTRGVCVATSAITDTDEGDIWYVANNSSSEKFMVCTGEADEDAGYTFKSLKDRYGYFKTTQAVYDAAESESKAEKAELPDPNDETSKKYIHIIGTTNYYVKKLISNEIGYSVVINGMTEEQKEEEAFSDIENGDLFAWDGDTWENMGNIAGASAYFHIKYANSTGISGTTKYYVLTEDITENPGEAPGKYMGTYSDNQRADESGHTITGIGTIIYETQSYKWVKCKGDDGFGYEYIYCLPEDSDRVLVPYFTSNWMSGETYQQNDYYPTSANTPESAFTYTSEARYDWQDNAVSVTDEHIYRYKCYRTKDANGVWGPFIGDKSTSEGEKTNGVYAILDASYGLPIVADFDNDSFGISCNEGLKTLETLTETLTPRISYGATPLTVTNIASSGSIPTYIETGVTEDKKLTLTIAKDRGINENNNLTFTITGTTGNYVYSGNAKVKIFAVKGGTVYSIVPTKSGIKKNSQGEVTDETILKCNVLKRDSNGIENIDTTAANNNFEIRFVTGTTESVFDNINGLTATQQKAIDNKIVFKIYTKANSTATTYTVLNDEETVYVVSDGASNIVADIDNELDSVPLTYEGKVESDTVLSTNISIWNGNNEATVSQVWTVADSATTPTSIDDLVELGSSYKNVWNGVIKANIAANDKKKTVKIKASAGTSFPSSIALPIYLKGSGETGTTIDSLHKLTFSISGVKAGNPGENAIIYNILPSDNALIMNPNKGNLITPTALTATIIKKEAGNTTAGTPSYFGLSLTYTVNGGTSETEYPESGITIATAGITSKVGFILRKDTNCLDKETIPVITGGTDGKGTLIVDIDNELDSIPLTHGGLVDSGSTTEEISSSAYTKVLTNVTLWSAATKLSISILKVRKIGNTSETITLGSSYVDIDSNVEKRVMAKVTNGTSSAKTLSVCFKIGTEFTDKEQIAIIAIDGEGNEKEIVFTVKGIKASKDGENAIIYNILPSNNEICYDPNTSEVTDPSSALTATVLKKDGSDVTELSVEDFAEEGITLKYFIDEETTGTIYTEGGVPHTKLEEVDTKLAFKLYNSEDELIDAETIPRLEAGLNGEDVLSMTIDNIYESVSLTQTGRIDDVNPIDISGTNYVTAETTVAMFSGSSIEAVDYIRITTASTESGGVSSRTTTDWTNLIEDNNIYKVKIIERAQNNQYRVGFALKCGEVFEGLKIHIYLVNEDHQVIGKVFSFKGVKNGSSAYIADIDNELESVGLTYEGNVYADTTASTNISMWYGGTQIAIARVFASDGEVSELSGATELTTGNKEVGTAFTEVKYTDVNNFKKISLKIRKDISFPASKQLMLYIKGSGETFDESIISNYHKLTFSFSGVRAGSPGESPIIYSITPSNGYIEKNPNNNTITPSAITCTVTRKEGLTTITKNGEDVGDWGVSLWSSINSGTSWTKYTSAGTSTSSVNANITFKLVTGTTSGGTILDKESIPMIVQGVNGEGSYFIDMDNELDVMPLDYNGIVVANDATETAGAYTYSTVKTTLSGWYGKTQKVLSDIAASGVTLGTSWTNISGTDVIGKYTTTGSSQTVTIGFRIGWSSFGDKVALCLSSKIDGSHDAAMTFNIKGVKAAEDGKNAIIYQVLPDDNSVVFSPSNSSYTPSITYCKIQKKEGTTSETINGESASTYGLKLEYSFDGSSFTEYTNTGITTSGMSSSKKLIYQLTNSSETETWDKETIPLISNGTDGTSPYVADIDNEMTSIVLNEMGLVDSNYCGDITITAKTEAQKYYTASTKVWVNEGSQKLPISEVYVSTSSTSSSTWSGIVSGDVYSYLSDTNSDDNIVAKYNESGNTITLDVAAKAGFNFGAKKTLYIYLKVSGGSIYTLAFVLTGTKNGTQYEIKPAYDEIHRDSKGILDHSALTCTISEIKDGVITPLTSLINTGLYLFYSYTDGGTPTSTTPTTEITINSDTTKVIYYLTSNETYSADTLIDRETVKVYSDGKVATTYSVKLSSDQVVWNANDGTLDPTSVTVTVKVKDEEEKKLTTYSAITGSGLYIAYRFDNETTATTASSNIISMLDGSEPAMNKKAYVYIYPTGKTWEDYKDYEDISRVDFGENALEYKLVLNPDSFIIKEDGTWSGNTATTVSVTKSEGGVITYLTSYNDITGEGLTIKYSYIGETSIYTTSTVTIPVKDKTEAGVNVFLYKTDEESYLDSKTAKVDKRIKGEDAVVYTIGADNDSFTESYDGTLSPDSAVTFYITKTVGNKVDKVLTSTTEIASEGLNIWYKYDSGDRTTAQTLTYPLKDTSGNVKRGITFYVYASGATENESTSKHVTVTKDGSKGYALRGPVIWEDACLQSGRDWYNGTYNSSYPDSWKYKDIIKRREDGKYYLCKTTYHENTGETWDDVSSYWQSAETQYDFVASKVLLADNAKINCMTGNDIYLVNSAGTVTAGAAGGNGINFWAGSTASTDAPFTVNNDGTMVAEKGIFGCMEIGTDTQFGDSLISTGNTTEVGDYHTLLSARGIDLDASGGDEYPAYNVDITSTPWLLNDRNAPVTIAIGGVYTTQLVQDTAIETNGRIEASGFKQPYAYQTATTTNELVYPLMTPFESLKIVFLTTTTPTATISSDGYTYINGIKLCLSVGRTNVFELTSSICTNYGYDQKYVGYYVVGRLGYTVAVTGFANPDTITKQADTIYMTL